MTRSSTFMSTGLHRLTRKLTRLSRRQTNPNVTSFDTSVTSTWKTFPARHSTRQLLNVTHHVLSQFVTSVAPLLCEDCTRWTVDQNKKQRRQSITSTCTSKICRWAIKILTIVDPNDNDEEQDDHNRAHEDKATYTVEGAFHMEPEGKSLSRHIHTPTLQNLHIKKTPRHASCHLFFWNINIAVSNDNLLTFLQGGQCPLWQSKAQLWFPHLNCLSQTMGQIWSASIQHLTLHLCFPQFRFYVKIIPKLNLPSRHINVILILLFYP